MKLSAIPVVKLPLVNVSTDPLDLLLVGVVLRMKQLAKTNPKFIELIHDRQLRIQISTQAGFARQLLVHNNQVETVVGAPEPADFTLEFIDSDQAVKTLLKGEPTAFMTGIQDGSIKVDGDFTLLMWFNKVARLLPPKFPKPVQEKVQHVREFVRHKLGK
ncbi:SCP-2 sterol transfer family protein [Acinetobacter sp. MD2(2019)]|uniref:SCP-2 sterol transfer family protein n=1 Tax=Acinetobacter sp. MD2(2019) TaxID=2605273 RepID=UPI002D1F5510|nr:SCP-2 sterol transfer family protein [Acinetobacter sp. MD2(2019)]MEB3754910.1 SCP2 sterol-binding domain-containing protein [Acinetobacter sp. MD2(2019)]